MSNADNNNEDDGWKLKHFRKMFMDYTKEFKLGGRSSNRANNNAATPATPPTPPNRTPDGSRQRQSSSSKSSGPNSSSSDPPSSTSDGDQVKKEKEKDGSNEKIADAKDTAKADDEEFENDDGGAVVAKTKIKSRNLQWKVDGEKARKKDAKEKKEEKEATAPYAPTGATSPYGKVKLEWKSRSQDLDEGVRKKKVRSGNRRRSQADRSGKSGRIVASSSKTAARSRSGQRRPTSKSTGRRVAVDKTCEEDKTREDPQMRTASKSKSGTAVSPPPKTANDDLPEEKTCMGQLSMETTSKETTGEEARTPPGATASVSQTTVEKDYQEIDMSTQDFKTAIRLMEIFKRNNILENALFPAQNETLRSFFEGGMKNPDRKILELISKAMDYVLDAVFFKGEDMDCFIDNELKTFIVDRQKSKPLLLDVIISRPEFLPQSWGGRTVVLRHTEATVLVQPDKKTKK